MVLGGTPDSLRELVEDHYGISIAQERPLGGELDTNVYVRDAHGREFTIKRSFSKDPADVRWQYPVLQHLESKLSGIAVPTLTPTRSGDIDVVVPHHQGYLVIRLADWVSGSIIGEVRPPTPHLLNQWGRLAAESVLALSDYPCDKVPATHHWDVRNSVDVIEDSVGHVSDIRHRQAVKRIIEWSSPAQVWLRDQPRQVVHQDLNDFNVVVDETAGNIVGLLDVGDTICAPRAAELIVASAYGMLRQADPLQAFLHVVEGYRQLLPLNSEDAGEVLRLASLRLCVNATTWTKRDQLESTEYGQRRMAATWPSIMELAEST